MNLHQTRRRRKRVRGLALSEGLRSYEAKFDHAYGRGAFARLARHYLKKRTGGCKVSPARRQRILNELPGCAYNPVTRRFVGVPGPARDVARLQREVLQNKRVAAAQRANGWSVRWSGRREARSLAVRRDLHDARAGVAHTMMKRVIGAPRRSTQRAPRARARPKSRPIARGDDAPEPPCSPAPLSLGGAS